MNHSVKKQKNGHVTSGPSVFNSQSSLTSNDLLYCHVRSGPVHQLAFNYYHADVLPPFRFDCIQYHGNVLHGNVTLYECNIFDASLGDIPYDRHGIG